MCRGAALVVTARTLLWTLLTLATALAMTAALITPTWLVGPTRRVRDRGLVTPSLGVYNGCIQVHAIEQLFTAHCAPFVTSLGMPPESFPTFWKAALVLLSSGLALLTLSLLASCCCCCCCSGSQGPSKAVFTVAGTMQAIAGLMFVLGLVLYPAGWGSRRIQMVCGNKVGPYYIGDCTIGWTYYLAMVGTVVTFICSLLSVQAEVSTSSSKVQESLLEGKNVICLI